MMPQHLTGWVTPDSIGEFVSENFDRICEYIESLTPDNYHAQTYKIKIYTLEQTSPVFVKIYFDDSDIEPMEFMEKVYEACATGGYTFRDLFFKHIMTAISKDDEVLLKSNLKTFLADNDGYTGGMKYLVRDETGEIIDMVVQVYSTDTPEAIAGRMIEDSCRKNCEIILW